MPCIAAPVALRRSLASLIGTVLAIGVHGCGGESALMIAASACAPPAGIAASSRSSLVDWADGISYASGDTALAYVYGFSASDSVIIQAVDSADAGTPAGCIMARLTSGVARPASGIGAGRTYVWIDSITSGYRAVLIPEDSSVAMTVHPLTVHSHLPGDPPPPTIGTLGFCGYCDYTAKRWCRGGLDSVSTTELR